ncbi:hypothetical protein [Spirosoma utsteinense]|uniref:Lipocalin-like domain-containing protein n=1 Tax=Spirosoma utsteinense TaxID=2585773 RepID=A0ABR6WAG7_9BACT|nr:hypothetical protein [Spirosoma utsteinense]MBC3783858.1 hypothetical protein [Spirosoma utsteinense]MBC3793563.1 hypothetical protein [Spirosoma utsteinense]
MKKLLYVFCLGFSLISVQACKKDTVEPAAPVVVGRWEVNRGQLSGFIAPYTNLNNAAIDLYYYDFGSFASRLDIRADKSFTNNLRQGGEVVDAVGTWEYTSPTLTLNYDDGDDEDYTYTSAAGVEELAAEAQNITFPLSATSSASGQLRSIYRK